jgi:hypothetical protein
MSDKIGKYLPGTNTIAYLASSLEMKKKSFITLSPGAKVIKNTAVNYRGTFNPTFSRVKIPW